MCYVKLTVPISPQYCNCYDSESGAGRSVIMWHVLEVLWYWQDVVAGLNRNDIDSFLPWSSTNIEFNLPRFCVIQNILFPVPSLSSKSVCQSINHTTTPCSSAFMILLDPEWWSLRILLRPLLFLWLHFKVWTIFLYCWHSLNMNDHSSSTLLESKIFLSSYTLHWHWDCWDNL